MLACALKKKHESMKRTEYIYRNAENAKLFVEFFTYDRYYIFKDKKKKIVFSEKPFEVKDEKTKEFLKFLTTFNIKNYFLFLLGRKYLQSIDITGKTGGRYVKIIRDKSAQEIVAAFILQFHLESGFRANAAHKISFWVQGALVSVDFIKLLFKQNNKFIYMSPKTLGLVNEIIDDLENKEYKFILFPYEINTKYVLGLGLFCIHPFSLKVVLEEIEEYPGIKKIDAFTLINTDVIQDFLGEYSKKAKRDDKDFLKVFSESAFSGWDKQSIFSVVHEILIRLMLFYFEEYGIDVSIPSADSLSPPNYSIDMRYSYGTRAPISVISENICKSRGLRKKIIIRKGYLHTEYSSYYVRIKATRPNFWNDTMFEITVYDSDDESRFDSIELIIGSKLFLLSDEELLEIKEIIFELGKAFNIFNNKKDFYLVERAIRHHAILQILYVG